MAKASSKSKSSKSKAKRKASPLARKAAVIRSASCKLPMSDAWKKARKAVRRPKGRAVAKKAMSLYSESCTLPMRDAWAAARAASKGTTPKPPRRARANKGYDTDFSRELSMFDYHHPAYEQTTGPFSVSEAFTHGLQPANRRNPRRSARRNGKSYDTDFSRELSMFDYHAPQFEQTVGQFSVSEAFTHGLQPANRRNPRKAKHNPSSKIVWSHYPRHNEKWPAPYAVVYAAWGSGGSEKITEFFRNRFEAIGYALALSAEGRSVEVVSAKRGILAQIRDSQVVGMGGADKLLRGNPRRRKASR